MVTYFRIFWKAICLRRNCGLVWTWKAEESSNTKELVEESNYTMGIKVEESSDSMERGDDGEE